MFLRYADADSLPDDVEYLDNLTCYTAKLDDGWIYEYANDSGLNMQFLGTNEGRVDYRVNKERDQVYQHHWRSTTTYHIDSGMLFRNVFPSILVRSYDYTTMEWTFFGDTDTGKFVVTKNDSDEYRILDMMVTNDFAGFSLVTSLNRGMISVPYEYSDRISAHLVLAEKKNNVMYTQYLWVLHDCGINGVHRNNFFIRIEEINILTPEGIAYQISVMTPSLDPMFINSDEAYISKWLSKFRIVEKPTMSQRRMRN